MGDELNLFQRFMFEAPGDDGPEAAPPDETQSDTTEPPVDAPVDASNDGPPDVSSEPPSVDDIGDDGTPPDMGDGGFEDDFSDETFEDDSGGDESQPSKLDDKLSAIMNVTLYQTFLSLIGDINEQLSTIKNNTDMFYTLSGESLDIVPDLKKLDENIRLYLKNTFIHERYEKNLLFFNKCMNLYKLLGDKFNTNISNGIKEYK